MANETNKCQTCYITPDKHNKPIPDQRSELKNRHLSKENKYFQHTLMLFHVKLSLSIPVSPYA